MTSLSRTPVVLCLLLMTASARGAEAPSVEEICQRVRAVEFPEADRPSAKAREALKGCNAEALYYGFGVRANAIRARQCAYLEMTSSEVEGERDALYGRNILMMIYANGVGAKRDLDVALALACSSGPDAHGPLNAQRVKQLATLKGQGWKGTNFDYCSDPGSTSERAHCASHEQRVANQRRRRMLERSQRASRGPARSALHTLLISRDLFVSFRSTQEINLSGSARVLIKNDEVSARLNEFMSLLERLERGKGPRPQPEGCMDVDETVFSAHRSLLMRLRVEPKEKPGPWSEDGSMRTQRSWFAYRNAWTAFARIRYPSVSQSDLSCVLAQERIAMLDEAG